MTVVNAYKTGKLKMEGDTLGIQIGGDTTNYLVMIPSGEVLTRLSILKVNGVSPPVIIGFSVSRKGHTEQIYS